MTPAAKARLAAATVAATTLPARITNAVVRARHGSASDQERIAQLAIARTAATELLSAIMLADAALQRDRRLEDEP